MENQEILEFDILDDNSIEFSIDSKYEIIENRDYNKLFNHPYINDNELIGNKTGEELGLQNKMNALTVHEIEKILYLD